MRFNENTDLPDGWYWEEIGQKYDGEPQMGLGFTQDWLEKRPLSYSSMKLFIESPRHYASKFIVGGKEPNAGMIIGKIVDTLTLEKEKFNDQFHVWEKATGTGSKAINKERLEEAQKRGVLLITKEDLKTAEYCVESLMDHNEARQLIEHKKNVQKKLKWRDRETNIPLVGYLDFESSVWDTDFLVDLKTGNNVEPDEFNKTIAKLKYHLQGAFYRNAYKVNYYKFPEFLNLSVETKEPYNVSLMFYESKILQQAEEEFRGGLLAFRKAIEEKRFHEGYDFRLFEGSNYFAVRLPAYYKPRYGGIK